VPVLFTLIASIASKEAADAARRTGRGAAVYVIASILAVTAVGFFVSAGYIATARSIGSFEASLWFGGGFLLLAIVAFATQKIVAARAARRAAERRRQEMSEIAVAATAGLLGTKQGTISALVASLAAGYLVALWRGRSRRDDD